MGAPRKHPPKGAAETIKQLAASGHSLLGIASKLSVSIRLFKRWLEEDESLQDAFDLGRETERQALHAMVVQSAKDGKPANVNAFFILKARHGYVEADQRSSQQVNLEVTVQNVMVVKDSGTDEEWEAKAARQQANLIESSVHTPVTAALLAFPTVAPILSPDRVLSAPTANAYEDEPPCWRGNA